MLESWSGQGSSRGVSWGGMFNLSSLITQNTRLSLNNTYTRSADSDARRTSGESFAFSLANVERQTLRYVERAIRSTQLKGEHTFGTRQNLDWTVSTAGVLRQEPDRSDLVYAQFGDGQPFSWSDGNPDVARRTFGDLDESNWSYGGNYKLALTRGRRPGVPQGGRHVSHDAARRGEPPVQHHLDLRAHRRSRAAGRSSCSTAASRRAARTCSTSSTSRRTASTTPTSRSRPVT